MALYLGSSGCQKINLDGKTYRLNMFAETAIIKDVLLSSDHYVLQDLNGLYLSPKEEE